MIISCPIIVAKASLLCSTFRDKSMNAKLHSVYRFSRRHHLVYRVATHESQRPPSAVHGEAMDFMTITRPRVHAYFRNAKFVINMDQTPIFFSYHGSKTLERAGTATINIRKSTADTKRATLALTITVDGGISVSYTHLTLPTN